MRIDVTSTNMNAIEKFSEKYKTIPVEHKCKVFL